MKNYYVVRLDLVIDGHVILKQEDQFFEIKELDDAKEKFNALLNDFEKKYVENKHGKSNLILNYQQIKNEYGFSLQRVLIKGHELCQKVVLEGI